MYKRQIVDCLGDKFPGGKILDRKTGSGQRDNLSGLCVTFFNFQTGCEGAVVQDIAVSLAAVSYSHLDGYKRQDGG